MSDTHDTSTRSKKTRNRWVVPGIAVAGIAIVAAGLIYWIDTAHTVAVDAASISAPEIDLSASQPGILQEVYVQVGDEVGANVPVARVGNELIKTQVAGVIISTAQTIGTQVNPTDTVVAMIDPTQLRVVGKVDENKGLSSIKVGDPVTFTVDAFGGRTFSAVIDEVSPTSEQSGIVFNISSQRQTQQFDVKARFDTSAYPELKNGMSARMWITTQ
jgi:multidrug resistance efflux pump